MNVIYPILHLPDAIDIGYQTENGVREIGFNVKPWLDAWDGLELAVYPTRPGEAAAYPAADVELVGSVLYWRPNDADTAIPGEGTVEVVGITADKRKLSGACKTVCKATTLATTTEPPEGIKPYYDGIINAAAEVKQAAEGVQGVIDAGESGIYLVRATPDPDFYNAPRADRTQEEIRAAVAAGKTVLMVYTALENAYSAAIDARVMTYRGEREDSNGNLCPTFDGYVEDNSDGIPYYYQAYVQSSGIVGRRGNVLRAATKRPLTLTGAVEATYDGREEVAVEVPDVMTVRIAGIASGVACSHTKEEIKAAVAAGKTCLLIDANGCVYTYTGEGTDYTQNPAEEGCPQFSAHFGVQSAGVFAWTVLVRGNGTVFVSSSEGLKTLTIKQGDTTSDYNGSKKVTVNIPDLYIVTVTQADGVYTADRTYAEIGEAVKSKVCLLLHEGKTYRCSGLEWDGYAFYAFRASDPADTVAAIIYNRFAINHDNSVTYTPREEARTPNPVGLYFHGAVEAHYDGSRMVHVDIPEGGSGGVSDPGTAHQMLVSDADGKAVWTDRTHYEDVSAGTVLAETTAALDSSDGIPTGFLGDAVSTPVVGETYTVMFNGTAYETVCKLFEEDGEALAYVFGNMELLMGGESTGEPFIAMVFTPETQAETEGITVVLCDLTGFLDGSGTMATEMTISITGPIKDLKTLDEQYIPSTIARAADVVTSVNGIKGDVTVRELPAVTTSHNGYFLRVVSGSWAAAKIDSAEGASF